MRYNIPEKLIYVDTIMTGIEIFKEISQDFTFAEGEMGEYYFPLTMPTRQHMRVSDGWNFAKESIQNIRDIGIEILDKDYVCCISYISVKTIITYEVETETTKIWSGELLELFNPKMDYRKFIEQEDKSKAFKMIGTNIYNISGSIFIPNNFLKQEWIYEYCNKEKYPEYFL